MPAKKSAAKKAPAKKAAAKKAPAKKAASSSGCPEGHRRVTIKMPTGGRRAVCAITSRGGLAKAVAAKSGEVTAADARRVFAAFAEVVQSEAKAGVPTPIPGVGKVRIVRRKERKAKTIPNPFDGGKTTLKIKARKAMNVVKIRPAKIVKDAAAKSG